MGKEDLGWTFFCLLFVVYLASSVNFLAEEWQCEKDFNVYDCEYEWYPVYGEEIPEEELTP